ncbi:MAG: hypothetical protein ACLQBC_06095 [Syntrophales bacterium]
MTQQTIMDAQIYLTTQRGDEFKRIVDIESLRRKHSDEEIIDFLKDYLREKGKSLRSMILIDKTHRKVDEIVASMFRLTMAIKTLEDGKEVKRIVEIKQGTEKSGRVLKRDRSSHSSTRKRKDLCNDGEDRKTRDGTQRAA